ncbi:hypothetical protein NEUTE2DRAFT_64763 [Neurospora tetrasperma FGSC 2509]|nr:hypothetical protein NEUTE2DRAFT_64763 [Neurospora tetrasperma FGSC 2509]
MAARIAECHSWLERRKGGKTEMEENSMLEWPRSSSSTPPRSDGMDGPRFDRDPSKAESGQS